MEDNIKPVKRSKNNSDTLQDLDQLTKEELIEKIKVLQTHNVQLRNVIAKTNGTQKNRPKKNQKPFDFTKCKTRHILLKVLYLGWDYHGFAVQEDTPSTIEHHLFNALIKTCLVKDRASSNYHRCGRTDKGVSAFGQTISLTVRSNGDSIVDEINYCAILNRALPDTIRCIAWCSVPTAYSARFDCKTRTYKYFFPASGLNVQAMRDASNFLLGTHDFRNLCKMDVGNGVVKFIRDVSEISILSYRNSDVYVLTIKGRAFLWHQIRCIMGVLLLVGQNKEQPEIVKDLLDVKTNPRKPDYNMASEIPLNLFYSEYDVDEKSWIYGRSSLNSLIQKLRNVWTVHSIKTTMLEVMLQDLESKKDLYDCEEVTNNLSDCLLTGVRPKKYVPLLKRQKCDSLEDKIQHYVKRQKLQMTCNNEVEALKCEKYLE